MPDLYMRYVQKFVTSHNQSAGSQDGTLEGGESAEGLNVAEIPTSLDEVLIQAQTDFASAVAVGAKRLRLDILIPGLNEQVCECM